MTAATARPIAHMSAASMKGCDISSSMAFTRRYAIEYTFAARAASARTSLTFARQPSGSFSASATAASAATVITRNTWVM